jgi:hypothetical protein
MHPEQKEEKIVCGKIWKGKKPKKKGKEGKKKKNCRIVHQAQFLRGSETIISNNRYILFIVDLHCSY